MGPIKALPRACLVFVLVAANVCYSSSEPLMLVRRATLPVPPGTPNALLFSPDGKLLIIGGGYPSSLGSKGGLVVWDIRKHELTSRAKVRANYEELALTPDGRKLIAMDEDEVHIWNLTPLKRVARIRERGRRWSSMSLSPDGKTLALADVHDSNIHLFDPESRKKTRVLSGKFSSVAFGPDGRLLAAGENIVYTNNYRDVEGGQGHIYLWDTATWQERGLDDPAYPQSVCDRFPVDILIFSSDGKLLSTKASNSYIWNLMEQRPPTSLRWQRGPHTIKAAAFSPDGKILVTVGSAINLWDTASGSQLLSRTRIHENGSCAVACSPDGEFVATGGTDRSVALWEVSDFAERLAQIARGGDVDAKDEDGWTALHNAAYYGHEDIAGLLIAKKADVNAKDKDGWTPLHNSAKQFHKNVAELLIAAGAAVDAKTDEWQTPLHLALQSHGDACKDVVELLIGAGADVNAKDGEGQTCLHLAVPGQPRHVVELLILRAADVNAKDKEGQTALHRAAGADRGELVELLIAKGADVDAKGEGGKTPLHMAAGKGTIELLIIKGADVNAKDLHGQTRLHRAAGTGERDVAELLITEGADLNARDVYGQTPLHHAANSVIDGSEDVAELLITKGADPDVKNIMGETPLDVVPSSRHNMRKLLRRHGGQ